MGEREGKAPTSASGERRSDATGGGGGALEALTDRFGPAGARRFIQRRRALQRAAREAESPDDVQTAAARGLSGGAGPLPHQETIQRAFGHHDIGHIKAHTDAAAVDGANAMGAEAFATGDRVAFGGTPSLHTAAHEAAHVVQQRGGVQLKGGVGEEGDVHERHADEVADLVVQGKSAEAHLDLAARGSTHRQASAGAVQRKKIKGSDKDVEAMTVAEIKTLSASVSLAKLSGDERNAIRTRLVALQATDKDATPLIAQLDSHAFENLAAHSSAEAEAPSHVKLPKELTDGMGDAWGKSFPGGKSQEHGGLLATEKDGSHKWKPGTAGKSGSFQPNYGDIGPDEKLAASGHTHPYDASEGGMTDVAFSGADLANLVWQTERVKVVRSGDAMFMVTKTAEFDQIVKDKKTPADREAMQAEMKKTWNDTFAGAKGKFIERVETAVKAVCSKYHLVFYKGKNDQVSKA